MAWTVVAHNDWFNSTSGTTGDSRATFHVEVGDIIVANYTWGGTDTTLSIATSVGDDSFTILAHTSNGTIVTHALAWVQIGTHNETATFRATLADAKSYRYGTIWQFRPDAGETVTRAAGPSAATGNGTAIQSGNANASGDDLLAFAGAVSWNGTASSPQINDAAADDSHNVSEATGFYKLFTSALSGAHGQCTYSQADVWIADILVLASAVATGGGGKPMYAYAQQ